MTYLFGIYQFTIVFQGGEHLHFVQTLDVESAALHRRRPRRYRSLQIP